MPTIPAYRSIFRLFIRVAVIFLSVSVISPKTVNAAIPADLTESTEQRTRIELTDGSVIFGTLVDYRGDIVTMKTSFSDSFKIKAEFIKHMYANQPAIVLLDDKTVVEAASMEVQNGDLKTSVGTIALTDVDIVNPEDWERGIGYHWEGNTGAALALNRGNTETDDLDITLNTTLTSTRDRFTLRGNIDKSYAYNRVTDADGNTEKVKQTTADRWKLTGKYDYFLENPKYYLGANVSAEADELADIKMRTYFGPYFGSKLIERDELTLEGELGIGYVSTDFYLAEDTDYTGLNWALNGESNILGGDSRLYLTHTGILNTEDASQVILNTTLGLGFPLFMGLDGAAEITLDYDGAAAEGKENLDQVYKFRVGYSW